MSSAVILQALSSCLKHPQLLQLTCAALLSQSGALPGPAWALHNPSSSCTVTTTRCYASDATTTTTSSSSTAHQQQHKQQHQNHKTPQQQHAPGAAAFSTAPDAFTASLQSKTEQEVLQLLERARAAKLAEAAAAAKAAAAAAAAGGDAGAAAAAADASAEAEEEDDTVDVINPETGEAYGPRGKEPTRYGDWEIKGRCTDFS